MTEPPPQARAVFGTALGLAERYAQLLAGPGTERGLIGPREVGRLWDRHLMNCAAIAELVPQPTAGRSLIDLGSGAGLPGIVLAMLLPDAEITLLEPLARRVTFLEECVRALGLRNAAIYRGRAEDAAGQLAADVVTARAVAPLERLAGLALGVARPGGLVLAMKGAGAAQEVERARPALRRLGARDVAVVQAGSDRVSPPPTVVRFIAGEVTHAMDGDAGGDVDDGRRSRPGMAGPAGPGRRRVWRTGSARS
jgi:16S rRNA (guanine527-N7)-methyltransferase